MYDFGKNSFALLLDIVCIEFINRNVLEFGVSGSRSRDFPCHSLTKHLVSDNFWVLSLIFGLLQLVLSLNRHLSNCSI